MGYPYLLVICGLPSSGKTTIAKKVAEILETKHNISTIIISSEDFKKMASFSYQGFKPERETSVKAVFVNTVELALEKGFLVINDDSNYFKSMRRTLRGIARKANADYNIVLVDTSLEVAIKWNKERSVPIASSIIEEINQKFDRPGGEFRWDKPIAVIDPSKQDLEQIAGIIVKAVLEGLASPIRSKPINIIEDEKKLKIRKIERETRKIMAEVATRYKNADLAISLPILRNETIKKALIEGLQADIVIREFLEQANKIATEFDISNTKEMGPEFHVGLFGHCKHGKTMLARQLTGKSSISALDKSYTAPLSRLFDMEFYPFRLNKNAITLVEMPGNYNLIKHAVVGANMTDMAILVVAADLGLQIQSVEHFSVIKNLGIDKLVVVLSKIDAASPERVEEVRKKITLMLKGTRYENAKIVNVSSVKRDGIEELKNEIQASVKPAIKQLTGQFKMPIDHSLIVAGIGTVLTGTIQRGKVKLKDIVEIQPNGEYGHVQSLWNFGEDAEEATAGDRVGLAFKNVRPENAHQGFVACAPSSIKSTNRVLIELNMERWYWHTIIPKSKINAFVGLFEVPATLFPYVIENDKFVLKPSVRAGETCMAYIKFKMPVPVEIGGTVLLFNNRLDSKDFRLIGAGIVTELNSEHQFMLNKTKSGNVKSKLENKTYIVNGFFNNDGSASRFVGKQVFSKSNVKGLIKAYAGTGGGDVIVEFEEVVKESEEILIARYKKLNI